MSVRVNLKQKCDKKRQDSSDTIGSSFARLKGKISDLMDKVRMRAKEAMSQATETLTNFPSLTAQPLFIPVKATGKSRPVMQKKTR